jgi:hypothetical protein
MKQRREGRSYPFVTSKNMLASDIHSENSEDLLNELNQATAELMLIDKTSFGGRQWQTAHRRQQAAFGAWLRYIRKDPVFQSRSKSPVVEVGAGG